MKKRFLIGIMAILVLGSGLLLVGRHHQSNNASQTATPENLKQKTEENDMDAIIAALPAEDQEYIQELENDIRKAKADGDEEWAAELEKDLVKAREEILNPPELPEDEHEWVLHWEDEIRKAKKEGKSEQYIANLESFRDIHLAGIAEDEKVKRQRQVEKEAYKSMSDEERVAYRENRLKERENEMLIAKAENDTERIEALEVWIEVEKVLLESAKNAPEVRRRDQERKEMVAQMEHELDDLMKWAQNYEDELIADYKPYLHLKEVDGRLTIVGVRRPDEVILPNTDAHPLDNEADSLLPTETTPSLPDSPKVPQSSKFPPSTLFPAVPDIPTESIVNAQTQFQSWREDVDDDYLDVLVSQYMTPQEIEQFFPTEADRQNLTKRTERLQQDVVSKVRKLVNGIPNATQAQKSKLARELVTANFDKDFADAVIEQLQLDDK